MTRAAPRVCRRKGHDNHFKILNFNLDRPNDAAVTTDGDSCDDVDSAGYTESNPTPNVLIWR